MDKKLNPRIKELIQQLGEAIHESVSDSDQISGVVREIREEGFDVLLMLEATIGLNEVAAEAEETEEADGDGGTFTKNDVSFLKSLRISLPEQASEDPTPSGDDTESRVLDPASFPFLVLGILSTLPRLNRVNVDFALLGTWG